jgi:hypothetical protein
MSHEKTPEQHRAAFAAKFEGGKVVRLEDQLEQFILLIAHQLEALKTEAGAGMGYKALAADPTYLRKLKDLGATFNSATDAQIRLDKTAADRAKKLTKEMEAKACQVFVRALPDTDRSRWLSTEVEWHNKHRQRHGADLASPSDG